MKNFPVIAASIASALPIIAMVAVTIHQYNESQKQTVSKPVKQVQSSNACDLGCEIAKEVRDELAKEGIYVEVVKL